MFDSKGTKISAFRTINKNFFWVGCVFLNSAQLINAKNSPSSIRHWDSNSQPLCHEAQLNTTSPVLPLKVSIRRTFSILFMVFRINSSLKATSTPERKDVSKAVSNPRNTTQTSARAATKRSASKEKENESSNATEKQDNPQSMGKSGKSKIIQQFISFN